MIDCIDDEWLNDINRYGLNKSWYKIDWIDMECIELIQYRLSWHWYSVWMTVMHIDEWEIYDYDDLDECDPCNRYVISSIDELWVDQSCGYCNSSIRHIAIGQLVTFGNQWFSVSR